MKIKLLLLSFTLFACNFFVLAQTPVTVISTSGASYYALYSNLKQAFDSINTGYHAGSISISITGNTSEGTATLKLDSNGQAFGGGVASYSDITIKPAGGAWLISGSTTAGNPMIDLSGADHVTINGLNDGTDSLIISNNTVSATSGTCTIRFINDATSNIIKKTTILGAPTMSTTTNGGVIFFSTSVSGGTGNDNNIISNCYIANNNTTNTNFPYKLIYINGTTTSIGEANSGIVIDSNQFVNFRANGVYCNTGARAITVSNNHFFHIAGLASSAVVYAPIWISNSTSSIGEGFNIAGNYIGGSAPFCGGTKPSISLTTVFQTIYLNCATTAPSYINGNTIANLNITSTSTTVSHSFIFINSGRVDCGTQKGNLIGSMTDTSNLIMTYSNTSASNFNAFGCAGANTTPTFDTIKIENNMMGGFTIRTTSTSGISMRFFDPTGSTGMFLFRYNTIGSPTVPNSIKATMPTNNDFGFLCRTSSSTYLHQFVGNYFGNISNFSTAAGNLTGISFTNATSWRIDSNIFEKFTNYSNGTGVGDAAQLTGIIFKPSGNFNSSCIGNIVRNFVVTHPTVKSNVTGIVLGGIPTITTTVAAGNKINGLNSLSSDTSNIIGLYANIDPAQIYLIHNNEISLGSDSSGNSITNPYAFYGIQRLRGQTKFYFNSVLINGNGVGNTVNTYAMMTTDTGGTRDFRNNVFSNQRSFSSTSSKNNVAALIMGTFSSGSISGLTLNYNLYHAPGAGGALFQNGVTTYSTFSSWITSAYTHDGNSLIGNPLFISPLHLQGMSGSTIGYGDNTVGVSIDILNTTRYLYSMGAYENNSLLPVKLLSLQANLLGEKILLNWSTTSEMNNLGFEIQRSADSKLFEKAGFVKGNGNSIQINNYSFTDCSADLSRTVYYRLKQIDNDGKYEFSEIVSVKKDRMTNSMIDVYPNPFMGECNLKLESNIDGTMSYSLYDIHGKQIDSQRKDFVKGSFTIPLSVLNDLQSGIYFLRVILNDQQKTMKIIKQ